MTLNPETLVEVCLALHVRRAARQISRLYDAALAPYGLDVSQFGLLSVIAAEDRAALTAIADLLDVDPSTLSRTLKPLKDQNLILVSGGKGRGGLVLSLSVRGQDTLNAATMGWKAAQSALAGSLGDAQAGRLLESLSQLNLQARPG